MSVESVGQNIGFKAASTASKLGGYGKVGAKYSIVGAKAVGNTALGVGKAGVSAVGSVASAVTGIGQQPQAIIVNSAPPLGGAGLSGAGLIAAIIVGFIARKNDSSWSETFFFAAIVYIIFMLF